MNDEAHVRLVDAHAERVRGDDQARVAVHEAVLLVAAFPGRQPSVVAGDAFSARRQPRPYALNLAHGRDIDDARALQFAGQIEQPPLLEFERACGFAASVSGARMNHAVAQVGPVRTRAHDRGVAQSQCVHDVFDDFRRRGGGERKDRRAAHRLYRVRDIEKCRPEIVPPLRHAVRFVHDDEFHARLRATGEDVDECGLREAFRRHEHDARAAVAQRLQCRSLILTPERAIQQHAVDAERLQLVGLILHQRNQRRHDERHAVQMQGRQLVAQRLARPGRHRRKRVAPCQYAADDVLLSVAQARDPEALAHRPAQIAQSLVHRRHPNPPVVISGIDEQCVCRAAKVSPSATGCDVAAQPGSCITVGR
ncbi:conserved hypothetical protein [Burkholderia latens]